MFANSAAIDFLWLKTKSFPEIQVLQQGRPVQNVQIGSASKLEKPLQQSMLAYEK